MKFNALGKKVNITMENNTESLFGESSEQKKIILESVTLLNKYKAGKKNLEDKLVENEQWYKSLHWDYIRNTKYENDPEPVTAYLFSTLANKHADAMDVYPGANILPREQDDVELADVLSKIIPLELEYNDFHDVWNHHWWEKLKHGCSIVGVHYDADGGNELGSAVIKNVDAMSIYWEPGITDIQESANVFVVKLVSRDRFAMEYPEADLKKADKLFEPKKYITDDTVDTADSVLIVDRYKKIDGKLHLLTFCGENYLENTEDDEESNGLYDHGQYPFVFDTLFPEKDSLHGFGYIDILKNPQIYVDKLDQIISVNAFTTGRNRYLTKADGSLNEEELLDVSKTLIHTKGGLDESNVREFKQQAIDPSVFKHRDSKIQELKEISGANEFSRGEAGGGVTAASAIAMMQQASNKMSRDMISTTYSKFSQVIYLQMEIIAQFYDVARPYRVGEGNKKEFVTFSNEGMGNQELPLIEGVEQQYRKPIFDIKVVPEKLSPFNQIAHNELAKELYKLGMFNPEQAMASLTALNMMTFEGKEAIIKKIEENAQFMQQLQMIPQLMQENEKLKTIIQGTTGQDMGIDMEAIVNGQGGNTQG